MKFETSPLAARARETGPRWRRLLAPEPVPSLEEIERDAAARLGVPADLVGGSPRTERATARVGGGRRPGRLTRWARELLSPEPEAARRRRLEAEAAAELGLHDRPERTVH
ncbi:MAG TPA: hypothetical protein VHF27_05115 [Acidimicrobiales bacterium]|nr:hypothetical protein [Acidimicrobiales bacterium]